MKKCFLAFGILMGSIFGVSNIDVSAEENNKVEGNQLIENFKAKHPDWTFTYSHPDYDVRSIAIDVDNDRIVDGYYHAVFFDSDVKIQSGSSELYKFRSISRNYPWNTMETSINIPHL